MSESTRHRNAFDAYFRLGAERSIERLRSVLLAEGKAPSLRALYQWSSSYLWQERLDRLEREARQAEDDARITAIAEMAKRQASAGLFLQSEGMRLLPNLDPAKATHDSVTRMITEGAKLERLARGEATERQEVKDADARLAAVSDEELDKLLEHHQAVPSGNLA